MYMYVCSSFASQKWLTTDFSLISNYFACRQYIGADTLNPPTMAKAAPRQFRTKFDFRNKHFQNWFPGHMVAGLKKLQAALWNCDAVVEVHDARVPLSGRTALFSEWLTRARPHLLLLNKTDLTDMTYAGAVVDKIVNADPRSPMHATEVMYTDFASNSLKNTHKIIPKIVHLISGHSRHNRAENEEYKLMVIGAPNVGKSSLINLLRGKHIGHKATIAVGALPGITRTVSNRIRIHEDPKIYVLDSPGVLPPQVKNIEVGMKLAACNITRDDLVGKVNVIDYLLYWWNKQRDHRYVEILKLDGPVDNVYDLLVRVAVINNLTILGGASIFGTTKLGPDVDSAAGKVLRMFQHGELGRILLDRDILKV